MSKARLVQDRISRLLVGAAALLVLSTWGEVASAQSVANDLRELRSRLTSLERQPGWNLKAEQSFVDDIDGVVDRMRASGGTGETARQLRDLLEAANRRYNGSIEEERKAIIAADGDLEAAQESAGWQLREELALRTLYQLNWVYLEAATRYEASSSRRRQWLRSAIDGFGEFVGVQGDTAIVAESLYGRGLCQRALDQESKAIVDFKRALKTPAPAELAPRIRSALVESLVESERLAEARTVSAELLRSSRSGESEFLRAKVLLLTLASPGGTKSARSGYRREVTDCVGRLEKRGGQWARLGRQLVSAGITRPEEWLGQQDGTTIQWVVAESLRGRGKCAEAIPLYKKVVAADATPSPEVLLALGACEFEIQHYAAAYETLTRVKMNAETGEAGADAGYLRFKAAEAIEHGDPTPAAAERLEAAARAYLDAFPAHAQTFEAHYRLGEIERERGNLQGAMSSFDAVAGASPFHLRASFSAAQCSVELLEKSVAADGDDTEALAQASLDRLRKFLVAAAKFRERPGGSAADEVMLSPMEAHAKILSAVVLTSGQQAAELEEALALLEGFEQRYPSQQGLHAGTNALRAVALLGLHRYQEAEQAVQALVASPQRNARDYRLMKQLGVKSLELADEQRKAGDKVGEIALRRQALSIYEALLQASESGAVDGDPEGLRALVKDLKAQLLKSDPPPPPS